MSNEPSELEIDEPNIESTNADIESAGQPEDSIDSLREKLAEAEKKTLLHQADLENFRRRKSRETQDQLRYAALPLISSLLEVVDNLNRALQSAETDENSSGLREGVELVATQLDAVLENYGCKKIEALGQPFDPNLHEAIQMQPADEPANTVIMEVQTGYQLHDRVVRHAKVMISTGPAK